MKVLTLSDSPYLFTGMARVHREVISGLTNAGHDVFVGCWGWNQEAYLKDESVGHWWYEQDGKKYPAFPVSKDPKKMIVFAFELLKMLDIDVLMTMGDYHNFICFDELKGKVGYQYKWISYFNIDSDPINERYLPMFQHMDKVLVPSKFGESTLRESGVESQYLPYGVDDVFCKMDDGEIKREKLKRGIPEDCFRFINVSKNQGRKNIPAFLRALSKAHEKNEKIRGYLHTSVIKKMSHQADIEVLIKRYGLEGVLETPKKKISLELGSDDQELNLQYNMSDAVVCSSTSEGFCFPLVEAQACGLLPIATEHSAMKEHVFQRGYLVKSVNLCSTLEHNVGIIDEDDLAQRMLQASYERHDYEKNIKYAKGFSWNTMKDDIGEVIKNLDKRVKIAVEEI